MIKKIASLSGATLLGLALSAGIVLANPAGAPANQVGTSVAGLAQSSSPNFGQAVCKPAALTQTEDDGILTFLGLTPPGNTP